MPSYIIILLYSRVSKSAAAAREEVVKNSVINLGKRVIRLQPVRVRFRGVGEGVASGIRRGGGGRGPQQHGLAELHNKIFMPPARDMRRRIRPCTLYMCDVRTSPRTLCIISVLNLRIQFRPFNNSHHIHKYSYSIVPTYII